MDLEPPMKHRRERIELQRLLCDDSFTQPRRKIGTRGGGKDVPEVAADRAVTRQVEQLAGSRIQVRDTPVWIEGDKGRGDPLQGVGDAALRLFRFGPGGFELRQANTFLFE